MTMLDLTASEGLDSGSLRGDAAKDPIGEGGGRREVEELEELECLKLPDKILFESL